MGWNRRDCLKTLTAGLAAAAQVKTGSPAALAETSALGLPGPYRGRVVAVENPAVLTSGTYQAGEVRRMMRLGMTSLTGVDGWVDAWRRLFAPGDVVLQQDVEVLASPAAVQSDFARTLTTKFPACLAYQLDHSPTIVSASVSRVPFPPTGAVSAAYRATVVVHSTRVRGALLSDFVYFGEGRVEYSFNVVAPLSARGQLSRFELALARILLKRAATGPA